MARAKKPEDPKSFPLWQSTFSDLMNLLLCFFVLLFSMSTVDAQKYELVVQSLSNSFSVLPSGGTSVSNTEGSLISSGVSALQQFDAFMNASSGKHGEEDNQGNNADSDLKNQGSQGMASGINDGAKGENESDGKNKGGQADDENVGGQAEDEKVGGLTEEEIKEKYEEQQISESEKMAQAIEEAARANGIQDMIDIDFNGQYVIITLNGSILFNSGKAEVVKDAEPLLDKISAIVGAYDKNLIEIEGHTDTVPMHSAKYESNDVLSMYRALYVADYIRARTVLNPGNIMSSGRGEYSPIASNETAEGRALNRRVTIKIYNEMNSQSIIE